MTCPVCHKDMIVVEYKGIELDYCTECQGVWFDVGELEVLLKSLRLESQAALMESFLKQPEPAHQEKYRRCPICGRKMRKVALGNRSEIVVDACRRGDGLWFDGGELAKMLVQLAPQPQVKASPGQHVTDFLREVFQSTQPASQNNMEV